MSTRKQNSDLLSFEEFVTLLAGGCCHGIKGVPVITSLTHAAGDFSERELREVCTALLERDDTTGLYFTTKREIEARRELDHITCMMWRGLFTRIGRSRYVKFNRSVFPRVKMETEAALGRLLSEHKSELYFPFLAIEMERIRRRLDHYATRRPSLMEGAKNFGSVV